MVLVIDALKFKQIQDSNSMIQKLLLMLIIVWIVGYRKLNDSKLAQITNLYLILI